MNFLIVLIIFSTILCQIESNAVPAVHETRDELITTKKDVPQSEHNIQLEDFFWTGSGDGPPEYLKKIHGITKNGKEVIVKTETIIATVYLDGENEYNPLCLDCERLPERLPHNYSTSDRRFWLLTVVAGFLRPSDLIVLEDNLAKLYRIAFTRQQSQHLGIAENITQFSYLRSKHKRDAGTDSRTNTNTSQASTNTYTSKQNFGIENKTSESHNTTSKRKKDIRVDPRVKSVQPKTIVTDKDIRVLIHNVSFITEKDLENPDTFYTDPTDVRNMRPLANQTEIIYTVFVSDSPVLAAAAASDMKLVSENEVALVMGKEVFMKAEPYLKEPQATPLVPATKSQAGAVNIYNMMQNPIVIVVCSIVILLLLILLISLLLMVRSKRKRSAEVKRLSGRQALLSEQQSTGRFDSSLHPEPMTTERTDPSEGVDNAGYTHEKSSYGHAHERKREKATIHFPGAPRAETASTSTSDSSVYCPVNQPNLSLQNILDEKAASLFEKKRKSSRSSISKEVTYATIGRKRNKKSRHKRKYLGENRVGSIEEENTRSSRSSISSGSISEAYKNIDQYDSTVEAYNLNLRGNYHRNKVLQNRIFTDKSHNRDSHVDRMTSPTEAINREILKALQHGDKTSESGSVGSFLSMASVKNFPRSQLPEPLNRVLDPVRVTYYDEQDETDQLHRQIRKVKPSTRDGDRFGRRENDYDTRAISSTQSDHPDPGVIGPIVWEIHKKRLATKNDNGESPIHDPARTRNRFEGLLESAIQMYSNNTNEITNESSPVHIKATDTPVRLPEIRGKSAIVTGNPDRASNLNTDTRPLTAGPFKSTPSNSSTQPPSPRGRAWGSGAPSPLVRPLSAGPFHRPEAPIVDVTRILASQNTDRSQLSAAPLIEAIQNELKKFKRESSQ